ncbi:riboflavin synthase [Polynucleobacter paneuropaeus]|nr:riboflavin synthase [Polynucleobacter paneuropaeus]
MFTGIITGIGQITDIKPKGDGLHLRVELPSSEAHFLDDVVLGDSIALQGACMTVTDKTANSFCFDVSRESLNITVGLDQLGSVNLEKALRFNDRLGGHLVSGHVDGVGEVTHFAALANDAYGSWLLKIAAPIDLAPYLAYKGSIVVNGVSLTVNLVEDEASVCVVSINIIPHTLQYTTLGNLQVGSAVNLEVDLIARYLARMLEVKER